MAHLRMKCRVVRSSGYPTFTELATCPSFSGQPCVVVARGTRTGLHALALFKTGPQGITAIDLCVVPTPEDCIRSGEYPGPSADGLQYPGAGTGLRLDAPQPEPATAAQADRQDPCASTAAPRRPEKPPTARLLAGAATSSGCTSLPAIDGEMAKRSSHLGRLYELLKGTKQDWRAERDSNPQPSDP